jgi:hypothetical protein
MGKTSPIRQLQKIRNLRADNLSRRLAEARAEIARVTEEKQQADTEFEAARARADRASIDKSLQPGKVVTGEDLHAALRKQSALRIQQADARERAMALDEAVAVAERQADELADDLARARKIAIRTDISAEMIEANNK